MKWKMVLAIACGLASPAFAEDSDFSCGDPESEVVDLSHLPFAEVSRQLSGMGPDRRLKFSHAQLCNQDIQRALREDPRIDIQIDARAFNEVAIAPCLEALSENLCALDLAYTSVNDAGLAHLANLSKLIGLYLDRTSVSDAGVANLQSALPDCHISHY